MSHFLLDTDTVTHYLHSHEGLRVRVAAESDERIGLPIIVYEEIWDGFHTAIRRAKDDRHRGEVYGRLTDSINQLRRWHVISMNEPSMIMYDALKQLKLNVRANDLKIAAITLVHNAVVVTRNLRDFQRVPA